MTENSVKTQEHGSLSSYFMLSTNITVCLTLVSACLCISSDFFLACIFEQVPWSPLQKDALKAVADLEARQNKLENCN